MTKRGTRVATQNPARRSVECSAETASESPLWRKLVPSFMPGVLYLFDLGFFERNLFAAAQDVGAHVLMRLKKTA